jgi:hypothetical protein
VKRGEAKEVSITAVEPSLGGKTKEADKIAIDGGPNPGPEPTTLPEPPAIAKPIEAPKVSVPLAPIQPPSASATNAATLNLDALPERVREQILRARAAREQLAKVGFGKAIEPVPANEPPAQVQLVPVDKQPAPVEATPVKAIPEKEEAPKSKPKKAPNSDVESVGPEPSVPADLSPTATTSHLSPFAQFVANLEGSKVAPKGEDLIEQFLASNPKITPLDKNAPAPEVRTEPEGNVTGLVTETLARMYAEQGHVAKAIQAYEILKLRVPEKSSIFAARIEALKSK